MGFDFIVIAPLPLSHGFSFVLKCGVSFLVGSSVLLLMVVQQLVAILVLSQEKISACPSTLACWHCAYFKVGIRELACSRAERGQRESHTPPTMLASPQQMWLSAHSPNEWPCCLLPNWETLDSKEGLEYSRQDSWHPQRFRLSQTNQDCGLWTLRTLC